MLLAGTRLLDTPVMSLQTGGELARTVQAVVNPDDLQILAYDLAGPLLAETPSLLRIPDVREFSDIGIIVDSSDEFVSPRDVIKLERVYDLGFDPVGMRVINENKRKVGKVTGYTIDTKGFYIHQLNVRRPLLASLNETELLIHRSQIIEINDDAIVVHSEAKVHEEESVIPREAVMNPFRKAKEPQTGHMQE